MARNRWYVSDTTAGNIAQAWYAANSSTAVQPFTWIINSQKLTYSPIPLTTKTVCPHCCGIHDVKDADKAKVRKGEEELLLSLCSTCKKKAVVDIDGARVKGFKIDGRELPLEGVLIVSKGKLHLEPPEEVMFRWHLFQKDTF